MYRTLASTLLLQDRQLFFLASHELLQLGGFTPQHISHTQQAGINLAEIKDLPIILKPGLSRIHDQIEQEYLKLKTKPKIVIESSHVFPLLPLCAGGQAGVFVSHTILRYVTGHYPHIMDAVRVLPVNDLSINCDVALMYCKDMPMPVYFGDFVKVVKGVFSAFAAV
jgi:hypothetical protein